MNIKGKKILIILLIIVLLIFLMIYFRPLSLLEKVNESNQIRIIMTEFVYKGGNPGINSTQYAPLSSEQNQEFLAILKKYPYRRTILTPFSDGSMPNGGNQLLNLFYMKIQRMSVLSLFLHKEKFPLIAKITE